MTELNSGLYVHTYSSLAQSALLLTFSRSLAAVSFAAFGFPLLSTMSLHFIPWSFFKAYSRYKGGGITYFRFGLINSVAIERRHSHSYVK